jgi:tRNA A37 methylthiotransferase MiaB
MRGPHVSRPLEDILSEAQRLIASGVKEISLIAQDLTFYGIDLYGKRQLPLLLEKLATLPRHRLDSAPLCLSRRLPPRSLAHHPRL